MRDGVMLVGAERLSCHRRASAPLPLWERVAPRGARRRVRGISPLGELCKDVLQYSRGLLQHVIVPVAHDLKALSRQSRLSRCITLRRGVLITVDFNDQALVETNEIKNVVLERELATKFEIREPPITEQCPHPRFSIRRLATHRFCEVADALRSRPMLGYLRHEPLTRLRFAKPPSPTRGR